MCISPLTLKRQYRNMQGDFTNVVPCGKCPPCLKRRSANWAFRLQEEEKRSSSSAFVTLTYAQTPLSFNGNPNLEKTDLQKFFKRVRKNIPHTPIKYYACGEYGSLYERPHYHAILFNMPQKMLKNPLTIERLWKHGNIRIDENNNATIRYVTNYITKGSWHPKNELDDRNPEFSLMSKKMGLNHLTPEMQQYYQNHITPCATMSGGTKISLPRYFREKIYTKPQRIQLATEAKQIAEESFIKDFDNSFKQLNTWKLETIRKADRLKQLERQSF